jgi:transcriptional regulator GlxA family with amidase domain
VATIQAMGDTRLRDYVLGASEGAEVVGSICTGALILAAAGLLDGRSATTHWAYHGVLERLGARYVTKRWVEDGRFITSAGVSAGIDMSLHLAARLSSEPMARYIQLWAEYDPEPPFGPIDWSEVDWDVLAPRFPEMRPLLADRPDLLERLGLSSS